MTRPYSMDLRERAVARVQAGESERAVSRSGSEHQRVERGEMVAAVQGDGKPCCGEDGRLLAAASGRRACRLSSGADRAGDFTLRGLVAELAGRGLEVDYRTVWTFVHGEFSRPA